MGPCNLNKFYGETLAINYPWWSIISIPSNWHQECDLSGKLNRLTYSSLRSFCRLWHIIRKIYTKTQTQTQRGTDKTATGLAEIYGLFSTVYHCGPTMLPSSTGEQEGQRWTHGDSDGKVAKVIRRRRSLTIITTAPAGQKWKLIGNFLQFIRLEIVKSNSWISICRGGHHLPNDPPSEFRLRSGFYHFEKKNKKYSSLLLYGA